MATYNVRDYIQKETERRTKAMREARELWGDPDWEGVDAKEWSTDPDRTI